MTLLTLYYKRVKSVMKRSWQKYRYNSTIIAVYNTRHLTVATDCSFGTEYVMYMIAGSLTQTKSSAICIIL
eukprot:COSAG01_NODE_1295_length_10874_cov_10.154710_3_plen_71_part_00